MKTCGVHCQHPTCWASGKDEMIEAYKRMGLRAQTGRSGYSNSKPTDVEQSESRHQQIRFDDEEDPREAGKENFDIMITVHYLLSNFCHMPCPTRSYLKANKL